MGNGKINNILIPNVSGLPSSRKVEQSQKGNVDEFKKLLQSEVNHAQAEHGISLSTHAAKRLQERNLQMDTSEYFKLKGAMNSLREKGGQDSLVITEKAAYIVDVPNNKIVTAIDKDNMLENVFTKIDSTVIV